MHRLLLSLLSQLSFLVMFHFLGTEYGLQFHFLGTEYDLQNMAISLGLLGLFDFEYFQRDRGCVRVGD